MNLGAGQIDIAPARVEQLAAAGAGIGGQTVEGDRRWAYATSRRNRYAAPLARLPRRALPLGGPPGARRATAPSVTTDHLGYPGTYACTMLPCASARPTSSMVSTDFTSGCSVTGTPL